MVNLCKHLPALLLIVSGFIAAKFTTTLAAEQLVTKVIVPSIEQSVNLQVLSPGQQLNITLTLRYSDTSNVVFKPSEINWQAFELLNWVEQEPSWHNDHWQQVYQFALAAPVVGETGKYQLPQLSAIFFANNSHQQLTTQSLTIQVVSRFSRANTPNNSNRNMDNAPIYSHSPEAVILQDIKRGAPVQPLGKPAIPWLIIGLLLLTAIIIFSLYHKQRKNRQTAPSNNQVVKNFSAKKESNSAIIAIKTSAQQSNYCDWPALQQWLNTYTGFDPLLAENTCHDIELYRQFRRLRFQRDKAEIFSQYCLQCQQHLERITLNQSSGTR